MVFETELAITKQNFMDRDFDVGWINIQDLFNKVEQHYSTLNTNQKRTWERVREHIAHTIEHAEQLQSGKRKVQSEEGQRNTILEILERIDVI